jgi:hypothetical protein
VYLTLPCCRQPPDEKKFQRDLECALQASVVTVSSLCVETGKTSDVQCAVRNEDSYRSKDNENILPMGEMKGDKRDDSSHGQLSDDNSKRPVDTSNNQSARKRRPQILASDGEEGEEDCVDSDAEFTASQSSSESDDGDEEDFSSKSDSFKIERTSKKKVEKSAKVTKSSTTKSAAGGKAKPQSKKKETEASEKKSGPVKNKGDAVANKQELSTSAGKSRSEVTCTSKSSSSKPQSTRRPTWVPPAKIGENENKLGGVKTTSPSCSSIRLGLSRNVRPGKSLHPTARKPS